MAKKKEEKLEEPTKKSENPYWKGDEGWRSGFLVSFNFLIILWMFTYLFLPIILGDDFTYIWFAMPPIVTFMWILFYSYLKKNVILKKTQKISGINFVIGYTVSRRGKREEITYGIQKAVPMTLRSLSSLYIKEKTKDNKIQIRKASIRDLPEYKKAEDRLLKRMNKTTNVLTEFAKQEIQIMTLEEKQQLTDIEKKKIDSNVLEQGAKLANLDPTKKAYKCFMFEPKTFSDAKLHKFDSFVLICNKAYEETFSFGRDELEVDYYWLHGNLSIGFFVILGWIAHDLPIIYCVFGEGEAFDQTDYVLDAQQITDFTGEVKNDIIFEYRTYWERYIRELDELRSINDILTSKNSKLIQMIKKMNKQMPKREDTTKGNIMTIRLWVILLLAMGWVASIMFLILWLIERKFRIGGI